jgi:hypothetical protein
MFEDTPQKADWQNHFAGEAAVAQSVAKFIAGS